MKKNFKADIDVVKKYEDEDSEGRVRLIVRYYPIFSGVVQSSIEGLVYMIETELDSFYQSKKGELGVRVQGGKGPADPTATTAIRRVEIRDVLVRCNFSAEFFDYLEHAEALKRKAILLRKMSRDYSLFQSQLEILGPEKNIFEEYLVEKDVKKIAAELNLAQASAEQKIHKMRVAVKASTVAIMDGKIGGIS